MTTVSQTKSNVHAHVSPAANSTFTARNALKNDRRVQGQKQAHAKSVDTRWEASSQELHDTCPRLPPNRALSYFQAYPQTGTPHVFIYFLRTPIIWWPRPRVNRALDVTRSASPVAVWRQYISTNAPKHN